MKKLKLFTDGSVHVQSQIGYGAYLFVVDNEVLISELKSRVITRRFESTSSTKLELQILLVAFDEIQNSDVEITVYSDSQNISGLLDRRFRLESDNFHSKSKRLLNNAELYREFFEIIDKLNVEFVKVKGHKTSKEKDRIDRIFTLVDRASRNALRNEIQISENR